MYILHFLQVIFYACLLVFLVALAIKIAIKLRPYKDFKVAHKDKAQGVIFGRIGLTKHVLYSPCRAERHILVLGGSGEGKTSSVLIPTLRSWQDGAFVIDISGDISANVECPRKLIYAPESNFTTPYNVFADIDRMADRAEQDEALAQLALLIMPPQLNMQNGAKYFYEGGRKILTAALIAFYHQNIDFCGIAQKIIESDYKTLFNEIDADNYASTYISGFYGNAEQNISGCKQECDAAIALFCQNKNVRNSLRRPQKGEQAVEPQALETSKIFVSISDTKLELYAPLLAIITAQMLQHLAERPNNAPTTILLALDEFASLGRQEITPALRKLRKKHVRIMVLTQALADIDMLYGRDERTAMLNNLAYKVILSASDTDTQEYLAKLCGRKKTTKKSTTNNGTVTVSDADEWAVEPSRLGNLGNKLLLIHPKGYVFLHKNFYFK